MKTTDYLDLPELTITTVPVELNPKERNVYERMVRDMVVDLDGAVVDAANAAALSGKLLQLASGAVYDETGQTIGVHERKLDALEDLLEAANGRPPARVVFPHLIVGALPADQREASPARPDPAGNHHTSRR